MVTTVYLLNTLCNVAAVTYSAECRIQLTMAEAFDQCLRLTHIEIMAYMQDREEISYVTIDKIFQI